MGRKSKIFLAVAAIGGSGVFLYTNVRLWDASARTHWTGQFAPGETPTVIIVLGMGQTPTHAIDDRAELAADVWKTSLAQTIIASGGQGRDDDESEAATLEYHLMTYGVPKSAILREPHSTSTFENLTFSAAVMKEHGLSNATVAVVTHDFHACRAEEIARSLGLRATVISTPGTRLGNRAFIYTRELLAFWKWRILGW